MATLNTMTRDINNRNNTGGVSVYLDASELTSVLSKLSHIQTQSEPILIDALLAASNTVVNAAKTKCPHRTGTLKRSIHAEVEGNDSVLVGTDVSYAKFVEMGTIKMKASPYLLPALTENTDRVERQAQNAMKKLLSEA